MIASRSILLSFEPPSAELPLKGPHDPSGVGLVAGWHCELNPQLPCAMGRQHRQPVVAFAMNSR